MSSAAPSSTDAPAVQPAPSDPAITPPGLKASLRLLLQHLGDHLDLLRVETGQELSRFGAVVLCYVALVLFIQLGVMMGLTLLMASFWQTEYRTHTILFSALVLLGGAVYCVLQLKRLGRQAANRFSASGQQWRRDLKLLQELI